LKTFEEWFLDKTFAPNGEESPSKSEKAARPDMAALRRRAKQSRSYDAWRQFGDVLADRKGGVITCLDARTGRQKWQGKLGGTAPWWASITAGDLFIRTASKLFCVGN